MSGDYSPVKTIKPALQWLDTEYPGWANAIDLDSFDLMNPFHCVLGQLFSDQTERTINRSIYDIGNCQGVRVIKSCVICGEDHWASKYASGYVYGINLFEPDNGGRGLYKCFSGEGLIETWWRRAIRRRQASEV